MTALAFDVLRYVDANPGCASHGTWLATGSTPKIVEELIRRGFLDGRLLLLSERLQSGGWTNLLVTERGEATLAKHALIDSGDSSTARASSHLSRTVVG